MPKTRDWSPDNTLVLILGLGLHEWADENDPSWARHRTLATFFRQAGVPDDQLLFWEDRDGHPDKFRKNLPKFLQNSDEDTLFIFYYAGHGDIEDDEFYFCHPDTDDSVTHTELLDIIEDNFEGYQAFFTVDSCHSGALAREIASRDTEYGYGALTSSTKEVASNGWILSDCLIQALHGDSAIDTDGDGTVSFQELADHMVARMRDEKNQPADFQVNDGFDASFRLSTASRSRK